jgi:PAS domain S-box-containing protein
MSVFKKIFLGKDYIQDRKVYKYSMLRVQFNLILIASALFYIGVDGFNGIDTFFPYYFLMIGVGALGLVLNRFGYHGFSNGLLIVFSNSLVFLFADSDSLFGGLFFYFILISLAALILFSHNRRVWGILSVAVSICIGILAFIYDFHLLPIPGYDDPSIRVSFLANFIAATLSCALIVYFLINENHHSERRLEENQQQLITTANQLKQNKERFEMAVKGAKAGIYEWNLSNNSIFISEYWKELLGYRSDELDPISIETYVSFVHPDDMQASNQKIQEIIKTHEPYQGEVRLLTKNGIYKWFLDSGLVRTENDTNTTFVLGSLIDIDDRKKAEQEILLKNDQLAKINEELDRFVYSASHDMRAPLSSLLGLIDLSERTSLPNELKEYHRMMRDRIKVMEGFIKEVTDYSRNARLELLLNKHSLAMLVNEVFDNLAYSLVDKKMQISVDIDPNLIISTDAGRLKIVLSNIVSNAFKYHNPYAENPFIAVAASFSGHQIAINVKDNGLGIAPEHHQKIFDMFYRASEISDGSGLGLYIVKETLGKLNGSISFQSEIGVGSTFSIYLPIS